MMGIAPANLADILRAILFGACRNRERQHGTAIQNARIRVTTRIGGRRILDWKEIDKVIKRRDVFEALNRCSLHGQQDRLTSYGRIERESLPGNYPSFYQEVTGTVHDVLRGSQIANSPARRAKTGQADPIALVLTLRVFGAAVRLANGLWK